MNYLEGSINEPVFCLRQDADHFVSCNEEISPIFHCGVLVKKVFWDEIFSYIKVEIHGLLWTKALMVAVGCLCHIVSVTLDARTLLVIAAVNEDIDQCSRFDFLLNFQGGGNTRLPCMDMWIHSSGEDVTFLKDCCFAIDVLVAKLVASPVCNVPLGLFHIVGKV